MIVVCVNVILIVIVVCVNIILIMIIVCVDVNDKVSVLVLVMSLRMGALPWSLMLGRLSRVVPHCDEVMASLAA